ncbi:transposase [Clostridium cochlearium]|uniref:transposase n=1 Tax=Clostridium cochlearium TaxID=1494 RepID=UPI001FAB8998|nr:transposase [Clostridium cochlearium]
MDDSEIKVRFIKFIEEVHNGDKIEIKEVWIITTDKFTSAETLWKIIHKRWDIENNVFHQLKMEWHLDHCFFYSLTGVETVLMFIIIALNLMQLYFLDAYGILVLNFCSYFRSLAFEFF